MRVLNLPFLLIAVTVLACSPIAVAMPIQDGGNSAIGTSTWKLDNQQSSLVCAVSHYGLSFIYGRFNTCAGSVEMNFQEPDQSKFRFKIDADSIDTNDASRDITLRGESCLDARQYESITFESLAVEAEDKKISGKTKRTFLATGNLTIHGETRRVTIPIELLAIGNGPDQQLRCGFMSRFVVSRNEFGLNALAESIGDSIAVTFCFQAVRQEERKEEANEEVTDSPFRFSAPGENDKTAPEEDPIDEKQRLEDLFTPSDQASPSIDDLPGEIGS